MSQDKTILWILGFFVLIFIGFLVFVDLNFFSSNKDSSNSTAAARNISAFAADFWDEIKLTK